MLKNIGHTIKGLAYVVLIIAVIVIVLGIAANLAMDGPAQRAQRWTMVLSAVAYAVSAVVLYGFGQLIETSQKNAETNAEILAILKENLSKAEQGKAQTGTEYIVASSITQRGTSDQ